MKIIKLDAIESTNTLLKEMCRSEEVDNYTVISAINQLNGRGQMTSRWESEKGKNLTFSILIKFSELDVSKQFYISKMISLAISEVLNSLYELPFKIKWPNDILTDGKKVCGILIENSVKRSEIQHSIIGIGLNVNQESFVNLPNATSLKILTSKDYDLDVILKKIIDTIKIRSKMINENRFNQIDELYFKSLYLFKKPSMYKNTLTNNLFMGKIVGVTKQGQLEVELEDETLNQFNLKEIEFLK